MNERITRGVLSVVFCCAVACADGEVAGPSASVVPAGEFAAETVAPAADSGGEPLPLPQPPDGDGPTVVTAQSEAASSPLLFVPSDPGTAAWVEVPADQVHSVCALDPGALARADRTLGVPWAVVRHGRLCHSYLAKDMAAEESLSATKTLGGVVTGIVAYQTRMLPDHGRKTGPLRDTDRVDHWLDAFDYNRDARLGHVLGMVAPSRELTLGGRVMVYDAFATYLDTLSPILNSAIQQDAARLGANLDEFTQRFLFDPLGMTQSTWSDHNADKTFAFGWSTSVFDMARLGLLILNQGMWNAERLLDAEWIYRMTHPAFEDANTGWGYLTWLNAASNHHFKGVPLIPSDLDGVQQMPRLPGTCAPVALNASHPHGLSDAPDCNYLPPYPCSQPFDSGVWQALGLLGQVIQGHPGLDLLIVAKNVTGFDDVSGMTSSARVWDAVRPAVVLADPMYTGNEAAFCAAYGRGQYAPDLH